MRLSSHSDLPELAPAVSPMQQILAEGCRRWPAARTDAERADNEAWFREFVDRPLTRAVIDALLSY